MANIFPQNNHRRCFTLKRCSLLRPRFLKMSIYCWMFLFFFHYCRQPHWFFSLNLLSLLKLVFSFISSGGCNLRTSLLYRSVCLGAVPGTSEVVNTEVTKASGVRVVAVVHSRCFILSPMNKRRVSAFDGFSPTPTPFQNLVEGGRNFNNSGQRAADDSDREALNPDGQSPAGDPKTEWGLDCVNVEQGPRNTDTLRSFCCRRVRP